MDIDLSIALLHENMLDKSGKLVTTSLTLIDVHDIARSACTYGVRSVFIAHPSETLRRLALTLREHWQSGFGSTYNPTRKEALASVEVVENLDQVMVAITARTGLVPQLIATSAREGGDRVSYPAVRTLMQNSQEPYLLLLGTGWGMSPQLLSRAKYFLEPLRGPGAYNHLSVRSACAIMLDRLVSRD